MFERTFLLKGGLNLMMFHCRFRFGVVVVEVYQENIHACRCNYSYAELFHIRWPRSQRLVYLMTETRFFG